MARRQNIQVQDKPDIPVLIRTDAIARLTFIGPIVVIVLALPEAAPPPTPVFQA